MTKLKLAISILFLALTLTVSRTTSAQEIRRDANRLIIENPNLKHIYAWNGGQLIPISFEDKNMGLSYNLSSTTPDFSPFNEEKKASNATFTVDEKSFSPTDELYTEAYIQYELAGIEVKRIIRLYPNSSMVRHQFAVRGKGIEKIYKPTTSDKQLLMLEDDLVQESGEAHLLNLQLEGTHWQMAVINFIESTDHHNNLVFQKDFIPGRKAEQAAGNILFARQINGNLGIVLLKESPLESAQVNWQGVDFSFSRSSLSILSPGFAPTFPANNGWTHSYSYAIGLSNSSLNSAQMQLVQHQRQLRSYKKDRDPMILANTWGDRSKDARMNESFILQEIEVASQLGITHLQLDDGWQQGLSKNSANKAGQKWHEWEKEDWLPHKVRFPSGFNAIVDSAKLKDVALCLWFNPSKKDDYSNWKRDADILIDYYEKYDIRVFKIDGVELGTRLAEQNLRKFFERVVQATGGKAVFNLDVTAGKRMGYFFMTEYGNTFLENRYTDWANYYPYQTLRNLWSLAQWMPAEQLQIEFLNIHRNKKNYPAQDPLSPVNYSFQEVASITLAAQPLAWMELSQLPKEAIEPLRILFNRYKKHQFDFHSGWIKPIGAKPNGLSSSGFQSVESEQTGYILWYTRKNVIEPEAIQIEAAAGSEIELHNVLTEENTTLSLINSTFILPKDYNQPFYFFKYSVK